jgi:hypothetical protein
MACPTTVVYTGLWFDPMSRLNRLPAFLLTLALCLLAAQPSSISGKWTGTVTIDDTASGTKIETPVELHLEQKDGVLSGKIGREHDPDTVEIRNAKVEGDTFTFEASSQETSSSMRFSLKVRGEQMLGDMKGSADGNDIVAKVSLSRTK